MKDHDHNLKALFSAAKSENLTFNSTCLASIREGIQLTVECDASEHSLGASLSQNGSTVAFHSRAFTATEKRYSVIEKKAAAIIDAVEKMESLSPPRSSIYPCG